jgi:hypothetical protein
MSLLHQLSLKNHLSLNRLVAGCKFKIKQTVHLASIIGKTPSLSLTTN